MNLYYISQDIWTGYDTYDSAVVAAKNPKEASLIHPSGDQDWDGAEPFSRDWCASSDVKVELIGKAIKGTVPGIIVSSFNAG